MPGGGARARCGPRRGRHGHRALGGRRPAAVLQGLHLAGGAVLRLHPVTRQQTALPELRDLCFKPRCGLLTVAAAAGTDGGGHGAAPRFQVVVIEEWQIEDTFLGLKVFSSDTGTWRSRMASLYRYSSHPFEHDFRRRPALGQSGAAYWIQRDGRTAIAYDSAGDSLRVIHLPESGARSKRCIGERHGGGGGLRYARADAAELEVWDSPTTEGRAWRLAHRVGIRELLGLNADATWLQPRVKPVGFHPTDVDVVFLALPAGVAAYSIEHGTMDPLCAHDCFAARAYLFPYMQIPELNLCLVLFYCAV
ncbi:hypothetical protein GQ55_5G272300 [Panicum hallii var. hallii]|uniref:F-box protein At3g26010-like beta-propeller domain-containing protein n=1 Tax=Panicum hallii var. hallii TaxID=1504633 RepID=A0A2T7DKN6_9POAL|nr:hypothetical protein GQ55_5G272300 [Panicum hallii var. hallii]